jgi:prolyl oligopeptidase
LALGAVLILTGAPKAQSPSNLQPSPTTSAHSAPPAAPVKPVVDDFYGTKVSDPYRYMENQEDPEVQAWMKAQDSFTRSILDEIPGRKQLLERIRQLDLSAPKVVAWQLPGGKYLVLKVQPGENTFKLYLRNGLDGGDKLLVDPEKVTLAPVDQGKGTSVFTGIAISDDGKRAVVGIEPGGDELHGELHVIDMATGQETGDVIPQVGAEAWQPYWLPDNQSFVYGRLQKLPPGAPPAEVRQKFRSYLHVLGANPEEDRPVFGFGVVPGIEVDPSLIASVVIQPGSKWAIGLLNGSVTPNSAYYIEPIEALGKSNSSWVKIADFADGVTEVAVHGDELYLLSYKNASRYQVLRLDARQPNLASAEIVLPQGEAVVSKIKPAQDALYVQLLEGGFNKLARLPYGAHPKIQPIELPVQGSAVLQTNPPADPRLPGALFYITSWTRAFKVYAYDPAKNKVYDTHLQPTGPYDDPSDIESVEVKVPSYDGTLVPLSIVYPKKLTLDGSNPTLVEGYGGYGWVFSPWFDPRTLAWYQRGGVNAICHVRGGGEFGEDWHLAGKGATKPNTWRDFTACAQYLIDKKYTSPSRLAGEGVSAGGILIGRAITTKPELFAAAIDKVGLSDALRFELTQNGQTNIPELGSVKTEDGFKALYAMSSYHNVADGTSYPAVLLETGINDPRVDPWQMAKMTARLQAATASGKPILLRVDYAGGHGMMGATRDQGNQQLADEWSFLFWQFGIADFQPAKH